MHRSLWLLLALGPVLGAPLAGCSGEKEAPKPQAPEPLRPDAGGELPLDNVYGKLGAHVQPGGDVHFRLFSANATRVVLELYGAPQNAPPVLEKVLERPEGSEVWTTHVTAAELRARGLAFPLYYGYRSWGPNWKYDPAWRPGSEAGFVKDVDSNGHRFNPNKLLLDPYARELSHDPTGFEHRDATVYFSGPDHRLKDSGPVAPKGVLLAPLEAVSLGARPERSLREDIIYEVHVRGLTKGDTSLPETCRGTYRAAIDKIPHLRALGVTAVEFLPVQETWNDNNDNAQETRGANYWGYSTLAFFAPDRRYACDKTPGGPTREFREMVRAFHEAGIKVFIDVVYNHTGEGNPDGSGATALLSSFRGLDNASYYQLRGDARFYRNDNGVSANLDATKEVVRGLVLDSLRYWVDEMGVDGFRFDLASILGNGCPGDCFRFEPNHERGIFSRAAKLLPSRPEAGGPGVDLIAEPWGVTEGTYQFGNYPQGWAEWNPVFRDTVRRAQNKREVENLPPQELVRRLAGSADWLRSPRSRGASINYIVSHDGFTLNDLYSCKEKQNNQPWPFGPSDGGENNNLNWDQDGDEALQRQAARTGLVLLALSAGVPMITGGDEFLRTQHCNNNPYNLDSAANWLDWQRAQTHARFLEFTQRLFAFRHAHAAFRPVEGYYTRDMNGNGFVPLTLHTPSGALADGGYGDDAANPFIGLRYEGGELGDEASWLYLGYNSGASVVTMTPPETGSDSPWLLVLDTAAAREADGNFLAPGQERPVSGTYAVAPRSLVLLMKR